MDIPNKTIRNGFKLPILGLGTWLLGGEFSQDPTGDEKSVKGVPKQLKNQEITLMRSL